MKGRVLGGGGGGGGKKRKRSGIDAPAPILIRKRIECAEWAKMVSHDHESTSQSNYSSVVFG